MNLLLRIVVNGVAIAIAAYFVPGLQLTSPVAAVAAAVILGVVNGIVKPLLFFLTLPFTLVTFGLFIFVLNAACLGLTAALVPGFDIVDFKGALLGALVISIVSWILNANLKTGNEARSPR